MYLKSIVVNGFKSFAEKVNIDLSNKVNVVVGPNGSGKSNVVDAISWAPPPAPPAPPAVASPPAPLSTRARRVASAWARPFWQSLGPT